jgi:hypothetical protein
MSATYETLVIAGIGVLVWLVFWHFAPSRPQIEEVSVSIWQRFEKEQDAVTYIHREIDRQINKVRGILTFDGILLVAFRFDFSKADHWIQLLSAAALFYISASILISLSIFLVQWGDLNSYKNFRGEYDFKAQVVGTRTKLVNSAVVLSGLSALVIAIIVLLLFLPALFG